MTTQPPPHAAPSPPSLREKLSRTIFSFGALVILSIALITSVIVALIPAKDPEGIPFWVMSTQIHRAYVPVVAEWNHKHPEKRFGMQLITDRAFERRMLSGFLAGTPVADLLELNSGTAPKAFLGPIDQVGFLDLTARLHAEGLYEQFNAPSFASFTSRGHIFGLPRSVHPLLLAYRADLVEAAGIDVSQIETWDDYFRIMRPLMEDRDGDGRPDRYLLNLSENDSGFILMLFLQNDGLLFDEDDVPAFANERNAHVLATIVTWLTGPNRAAIDVPLFTAAGHRQRLDGLVVGMFLPDWMLGSWKVENPQLAGKIKLMPLPAWEPGGRRTSTLGGTMIGINKRADHIEEAWELAKHLYTSAELAEQIFRENSLISPVKALWSLPFYDEPEPYCSGQVVGRMYIDQAPHIPVNQPSSPYTGMAGEYIRSAAMALRAYAERTENYEVAALESEALRLLSEAQAALKKQIARNVFSQTR